MARVVERWVIPKTTEAKAAKSSTAAKCEGAKVHDFLPIPMLWASIAAMKFKRPATTANLVP